MDQEKKIEEMARDLQETHDYDGCEAWHCGGCEYEKYGKNYFCSSIKQAEKLTDKGYRKASDVVDEVVKRLLDAFPECNRDTRCPAIYYDDYRYIIEEIAEQIKGGE